MKHLKTYESTNDKMFWKIQPTSKHYLELALNKISICDKQFIHQQMLRDFDDLPEVDDEQFSYLPDDIRYGNGSWMFKNDRTFFVGKNFNFNDTHTQLFNYTINDSAKYVNSGFDYKGEVRVHDYELDAKKYNL